MFAGLWILILGGFLQLFIGGEFSELAMAIGGAFLFSGKTYDFLIVLLVLRFRLQDKWPIFEL